MSVPPTSSPVTPSPTSAQQPTTFLAGADDLTGESWPEFYAGVRNSLHPTGTLEEALVAQAAGILWRLRLVDRYQRLHAARLVVAAAATSNSSSSTSSSADPLDDDGALDALAQAIDHDVRRIAPYQLLLTRQLTATLARLNALQRPTREDLRAFVRAARGGRPPKHFSPTYDDRDS